MHWNVTEYERFHDERSRPFHDLVGRIPPIRATSVVDLGCGTGELTQAIAERWPEAHVLGLDNSPRMLLSFGPKSEPIQAKSLHGSA